MAKRKRRRPNAGPPPVKNARRDEKLAVGDQPAKRVKGVAMPRKVSFRGVVIRAAIVSVLFYPYLIYIAPESSGTSIVLTAVAFSIMVPLGLAIDSFRYRMQMRSYNKRVGAE